MSDPVQETQETESFSVQGPGLEDEEKEVPDSKPSGFSDLGEEPEQPEQPPPPPPPLPKKQVHFVDSPPEKLVQTSNIFRKPLPPMKRIDDPELEQEWSEFVEWMYKKNGNMTPYQRTELLRAPETDPAALKKFRQQIELIKRLGNAKWKEEKELTVDDMLAWFLYEKGRLDLPKGAASLLHEPVKKRSEPIQVAEPKKTNHNNSWLSVGLLYAIGLGVGVILAELI